MYCFLFHLFTEISVWSTVCLLYIFSCSITILTHSASLLLHCQLCVQIQDWEWGWKPEFIWPTSPRATGVSLHHALMWLWGIGIYNTDIQHCSIIICMDLISVLHLWHGHESPLRSTSSLRNLRSPSYFNSSTKTDRYGVSLFTVENNLFLFG